ncbi:EpsG family protein [Flavobacterium lindanitolerans]|jgi:hypothetical protein|uniref:EpsG family protein n=1 Tax=Flavobacterium lindanitolerans TaxID=428988 RepID=UPI0023F23E2B|nr:EpsG family protein [Flavobacterium lindanitolerans]
MIKRIDLLNIMLFIVSPFLAIPSIISGVIQRSKVSLFLIILIFGLVSYLYIPNYTDDKTRYFEVYEDFKNSSFAEMFSFFFITSQDFILQSLFYFASQIGIPSQFVFAIVTMITVSIIFYIYYKIIDKFPVSKSLGLLSLILIFFSFSYLDLLSGTRFMFATSFVLLAYYLGIIEKKKWAFLFLIIAVFIHFSTLIFIPIFFLLKFFPAKHNFYKTIFITSFIFLVLPKTFVVSTFELLGLGGALQEKGKVYLNEDDFITQGLTESDSTGGLIIYYFSILALFILYAYLIVTHKRKNIFRNITLVVAAAINVFYATPTIFFRYALVFKFFFSFLLIYEIYTYKDKRYIYIYIITFLMNILTQIIISRNNIEVSFFNKESLMLITIIDKEEVSPKDFIY